MDSRIAELITLEAVRRGVSPALALAVAQQESGGNPQAVGDAGASRGLFQLQPQAARDAGIDPAQRGATVPNIAGGVEYLRQQLARARGNPALALEMYNKGPTRAGKGDPAYVQNVLRWATGWWQPRRAEAGTSRSAPTATSHREAMQQELDALEAMDAPAQAKQPSSRRQAMEEELRQLEVLGAPPPQEPLSPPSQQPPAPGEAPYQPATTGAGGMPTFEGNILDDRSSAARQGPALPGTLEQAALVAGKTGAAAVTSAIGTGIGAAVGGLTSPVTGPFGPAIGASLGSYGARRFNQWGGLEPGEPTVLPKDLSDALALGLPMLPYAKQMARSTARHLPGAAPVLHEEMAQAIQAAPETFRPSDPSDALYAKAAKGNPPISTTPLADAAQEVLAREMGLRPSLRSTPLVRVTRDIQALLAEHGGDVPLNVLRDHQQRLGLLIRKASEENWPHVGGMKRLYGAFYDAYDDAARSGISEAAMLKAATATARKEFALTDLADMLQTGKPGIQTRADGLVTVNGGKLLDTLSKKLQADSTFAKSFTSDELDEIRGLFEAATQLPRIPPPRGVAFGSGLTLGRGGLVGGATYYATGNPQMAALASGVAAYAPYAITQALMSQPGRAFLRQTLGAQGYLTPAQVATLSTLLRAPQMLQEGEEMQVGSPVLPGAMERGDTIRIRPPLPGGR